MSESDPPDGSDGIDAEPARKSDPGRAEAEDEDEVKTDRPPTSQQDASVDIEIDEMKADEEPFAFDDAVPSSSRRPRIADDEAADSSPRPTPPPESGRQIAPLEADWDECPSVPTGPTARIPETVAPQMAPGQAVAEFVGAAADSETFGEVLDAALSL